MQLTHFTTRTPHLVQALEALAQCIDHQETAQDLVHELSGITVMVAKKFTNDRAADGLLEAQYLTIGCISLGISQADIPDSGADKLSFLLHHGAEYVFQMGFRNIKELSALPYVAFISDFDRDPFIQQRNIKMLFSEICRAVPAANWTGENIYKMELLDRKNNQQLIECAQWLRKQHYAGPVKDSDLDANAVIAITVIFAIAGDGPIVARLGQKDLETLIQGMRNSALDIELGWSALLKKAPAEYHDLLRERMDEYRDTIVKKIMSKASIKTVITSIQDQYAGDEQDIEYD